MALIKSNFFPSLMEDFFNDEILSGRRAATAPLVNIKDDAESFYVEVVAPGIKKEDVKLELNGQNLNIRYEHQQENEEKKENYFRREFKQTSFSRSFTLPSSADSENIAANFNNGIISIKIPKKDAAKPKEPRLIAFS
jgi:HSP20 family protein